MDCIVHGAAKICTKSHVTDPFVLLSLPMTEDASKSDSLQDTCEAFCQCLYDLSSKVGAPIHRDCIKHILNQLDFNFKQVTIKNNPLYLFKIYLIVA